MIPLSDENPTVRTPWMTAFILTAIFAVWFVVQGGGGLFGPEDMLARSVCNLGMMPGELTGQAPLGTAVPLGPGLECVVDHDAINWFTPLLSLFLHGGWAHILGNSLFLWVFGRAIEDVMGHGRFLAFYLLCGLAASATHVLMDPASPVPTVGASGAISGVMGAYLVLFPRVRVRMFFFFLIFWKVIPLPAWAVLLWWFGMQLLSGLPQVLTPSPEIAGGVAVWAHIGGFLAGVLLVRAFEDSELVRRRRAVLGAIGVAPR
jgi:membrane associated rhomboid family serine protease